MIRNLASLQWEYAGLATAVIGAFYLVALIVAVIIVIAREPRRYWGLGALLALYLFIVFLGAPTAIEKASAYTKSSMLPVFRTSLATVLIASIAYYLSHYRARERKVEEEVKEGKR